MYNSIYGVPVPFPIINIINKSQYGIILKNYLQKNSFHYREQDRSALIALRHKARKFLDMNF